MEPDSLVTTTAFSREGSTGSGLNDSWVELNASLNGSRNSGESSTSSSLKKLLVDAQKESGQTSPKSSVTTCSKDTLDSPALSAASGSSGRDTSHPIPAEQLTQYIRDWSSRPEIIPPSDYGLKYDQPIRKKKPALSVRNTKVIKDGWLSSSSVSTMVMTHSACVIIGLFLGFCCNRGLTTVRG